MSWKPEVYVDGAWNANALRFETEEEARTYAADLYRRWTLTSDFRAVESDEPATHAITDGSLVRLAGPR